MLFKPILAAQNSNSSMNDILAKFSFDVIHFFFLNQYCLRLAFLKPSKPSKINSDPAPETRLPVQILCKTIVTKKNNKYNQSPDNFEMTGHFQLGLKGAGLQGKGKRKQLIKRDKRKQLGVDSGAACRAARDTQLRDVKARERSLKKQRPLVCKVTGA